MFNILTLMGLLKVCDLTLLVIYINSALANNAATSDLHSSMPFEYEGRLDVLPFSENPFFEQSEGILGSSEFLQHHSFQSQPYVANGYLGARIPILGHGFCYDSPSPVSLGDGEELINGWPLFNRRYSGAFVAGFFDLQQDTAGKNFPWLSQYGWDSVISAIPQWTYLSLSAEGFELDPSQPETIWGNVSKYRQNLSLENGIVSTSFTWLDKLEVQYKVCANRHDFNLGIVTLEIRNPTNETITLAVNDTLDFTTSQRCRFISSRVDGEIGIEMIVSPNGVGDVYGAIYSNMYLEEKHPISVRSEERGWTVSRKISTAIHPNQTLNFKKFVGVYTTDLDPHSLDTAQKVSRAAKQVAMVSNTKELSRLHDAAWQRVQGKSSLIEFPDSSLLTLASKASVYHINANMRTNALGLSSALSVSGLSSDSYGGQVFWDTDLWISMGILPFNPQASKSLLGYRIHTRNQAIANINSPSTSKAGLMGAIYPWTSGRHGNCTATGPCYDYEYHINAAISYSAIQLYLSGAVDDAYLESVIYPIVHDAALLFSTYLEYDENLSQYVSKNLTDPDEFAENIDNGAYTNAAMSLTIKWAIKIATHLGKSVPKAFTNIVGHIHVPHSSDDPELTLEYSGMNSSIGVKQADVIMMTYPLENELITDSSARKNLMYYATKQISTGPAMTFSIFSIVSAKMFEAGCSFESYLVKSTKPFLRAPFAQFSEQSDDIFSTNGGTHPAFPFLTAHGGFLQTILMGLLGMRFSYEIKDNKIERYLSFKARNLSLFPNGVTFNEVKYMNVSLSIELKSSFLIISNDGPVPETAGYASRIKIISYSDNNRPEVKTLGYFETARFKVSSQKKADIQSLTECGLAQFINLSPGAQGDVVESVHDGDNSTFWQANTGERAQILINLKRDVTLKGGYINWGDTPPRTLEIYNLDSEAKFSRFGGLTAQDLEPGKAKIYGKRIHFENVEPTAPFDYTENSKVRIPSSHNVTTFTFSPHIKSSRLLLQFAETHNNQTKGAKVHGVNFY